MVLAFSGPGVSRATDDEMLYRVPFVVLDVETTGCSPGPDALTEVAAVRYVGGEERETFHSLVDPGVPIPPFVSALTGIDDHLVNGAPDISVVLPRLLDMIGDGVVVGHNVGFDLSFIDAALAHIATTGHGPSGLEHVSVTGAAWRVENAVVDTLLLARRLLVDDVENCKLRTLARMLRLAHAPSHRALADVHATADLLHALIERATGYGVLRLCDLLSFCQSRPWASLPAHDGALVEAS